MKVLPPLPPPTTEKPCPFCGGKIMLWKNVHGGRDAIGHSLPPCKVFLKTGAEEFLGASIAVVN